MKRVNINTEHLLRQSQDYRDSDKKLLLAYWEREGLYLTEQQRQTFMNCTPAESITRARRTLKAKYPASEAVDKARFHRFKQFRQDRIYQPEPEPTPIATSEESLENAKLL